MPLLMIPIFLIRRYFTPFIRLTNHLLGQITSYGTELKSYKKENVKPTDSVLFHSDIIMLTQATEF
jgi:hypothetical protein